jgi:altronate dehydratase small subunit
MALRLIQKGGTVLKYGLSIGSATQDIQPGQHVHIQNVESNRGRGDKVQTNEGGLP